MRKKNFKKRQSDLTDFARAKNIHFELSPTAYCLYVKLKKVIPEHISGIVLDVGAGRVPYKKILKKYSKKYISLDRKQYKGKIDIIADAAKTGQESESFDSILSSMLLEHVPEPEKVLGEIFRILKKGGKLVLVVPHFFILHNEPNDYFRFTKYGIKHLLVKRGFKIIKIISAAGWFSFNLYLFSRFIIFMYKIPIVFEICFFFLKIGNRICCFLEERTKFSKLMPMLYIVIAQK